MSGITNQTNNFQNSENDIAQKFDNVNIEILNNYYSISNYQIKIELDEPYKIYIFNLLKNEKLKNILFTASLPLFILTVIISFSIENLNLYKFLQMFLTFYIILGIYLFSSNFFIMLKSSLKGLINKKNKYKNYILIDKEKIEILKEKENSIIINFKEIRKIEIEKNYMLGYNILIYNKQLKPTITYNVYYREEAFLIKEFFEEFLDGKNKIPNDETLEAIKDARANKNMTKVNLEDLKS